MKNKRLVINCGLCKDDKFILNKLKSHVVFSIQYDDGTAMECVLNSFELRKLKNYIDNLKMED